MALSKLIASWLLPTLLPNSGAQISHLEHANSLFTDLPVCGLKLTHIQPSPCNENQFSSVSFWPHGLQHARLPCPSPTPRAHSNSHPSSDRCHPTISSSVIPFSSCLQSFPTSGSFLMSWLLTSGVQSIGASASASVLPMIIKDYFPLGLTGLISLQSKGLAKVFSNTTVQRHQFFNTQLSSWSNSHIHT